MKIALLTYFAADNYGATLQAYATMKALQSLGHEVEFVNYVIPEPPRSWGKALLLYPKHRKFQRFRRQHFETVSASYKSLEDLQARPPQADCYLVGSDQTWNPMISRYMAKGFFLDFGGENVLRASYAASFGAAEWQENPWIDAEEARRMLTRFHHLSVREDSGKGLLQKKFGIEDVTQVLDPVLLFESYPEITGNIPQTNEIILYKLKDSAVFYEKARAMGDQLSLPLRSLGSLRRLRGMRCAYPESIGNWMQRIAGARYVLTDSFHGTVVSLLYHRPFVVCVGKAKLITRLESLLRQLGLEDRILHDTDSVERMCMVLQKPIDYGLVDRILAKLREQSFAFLKQLEPLG